MNPEAGRRAYLRGHIPGARYADLNKDLSAPVASELRPPPAAHAAGFRRHAGQAGYWQSHPGRRLRRRQRLLRRPAWWMLRWVGHPAAAVLDGGLQAGSLRGGATVAGEETALPTADRSRFSPRVDAAAVVDSAEVAALLRDPRRLSGGRARRRALCRRQSNPSMPSPATLPGAVNHPFTSNLGRRRPVSAGSRAAPPLAGASCRQGCRDACGGHVRIRRHRLPQFAQPGGRGLARRQTVRRLLERVDSGSASTRRPRRLRRRPGRDLNIQARRKFCALRHLLAAQFVIVRAS